MRAFGKTARHLGAVPHGAGGAELSIRIHVQFSSWSGSRRLPKSRERSAPTLIQAAPGFNSRGRRDSRPARRRLAMVVLPPVVSRRLYSTGHSVQRERGFTAAAPQSFRDLLENLRQDAVEPSHAFVPFVVRRFGDHSQPREAPNAVHEFPTSR